MRKLEVGAPSQNPIIIVGCGPVGTRILRNIVRLSPETAVIAYGDEPWEPYDRVKLVSLIVGDLAWADLPNLPQLPENHNVSINSNNRIVAIDRANCTVTDSNGNKQKYSKLILATGSKPWVPDIPGVDLCGVHTFRNPGDVRSILENEYTGRRTVILGGGLLGIELACGLRKKGEQVCIVVSGRLLGRQLDERAAELLKMHLLALGIEIIFGRASAIVGSADQDREPHVHAVETYCKQTIECACVILATGIMPAVDLATSSGLTVGRGIKVNDYLQTSDRLIYAAGECAEHRGRAYGLIGPGFEQADTVSKNVLGSHSKYLGSMMTAQLKGADLAAFSCFRDDIETQVDNQSISYESDDRSQYRSLQLRNGCLTGLVCIGEWPEAWRAREAVQESLRLKPWQIRRFLNSGSLWTEGVATSVTNWPKHAIVCNCMGVSRGLLEMAIEHGYNSMNTLQEHTNAGTGCGSCLPYIAELIGQPGSLQVLKRDTKLAMASALTLSLLVLIVLAPFMPPLDTLLGNWHLEELWLDNVWKQCSGYILLTLLFVSLLLSIRKRSKSFHHLSYASWRTIHSFTGALSLIVLALHNGLAFGHNLNRILLLNFLLLSFFGAVTGMLTASEGVTADSGVRRGKILGYWVHAVLFWPLPILLVFHIMSSYFF